MNQTCKYKNTNTQIQHMIKYQKDPTCCKFLKRGLFQDIKNDIPMSQIGEYRNTNLWLTNAKKTQNVVYFLKRGFFMDIFWVSHGCTRSSLFENYAVFYPIFLPLRRQHENSIMGVTAQDFAQNFRFSAWKSVFFNMGTRFLSLDSH